MRTPNPGRTYGVIALLDKAEHEGTVLLLQGATMEASEGVGKFLADPASAADLRRVLRRRGGSGKLRFEALLEMQAVKGAATNMSIVATRLHR